MDHSYSPKYFDLLSENDKLQYRQLQNNLLRATEKRKRGFRLDIFLQCLQQIRDYCQRGEKDDWKRCCVCGVCYLKCGIAFNSHQMNYLLNKCKSSINGALKIMNYKTISARGDINPELVDFLPLLQGHTNELRQWSVRAPPKYDQSTIQFFDNQNQELVTSSAHSEVEDSDYISSPEAAKTENLKLNTNTIQSPIESSREQKLINETIQNTPPEINLNDKITEFDRDLTTLLDDYEIIPQNSCILGDSDFMEISCIEGPNNQLNIDQFDVFEF